MHLRNKMQEIFSCVLFKQQKATSSDWRLCHVCDSFFLGAAPVPPLIFEMIMEHLEETCWENIHKMLKTEESLSIEFDEDVICDVCRSVSLMHICLLFLLYFPKFALFMIVYLCHTIVRRISFSYICNNFEVYVKLLVIRK